jgi:hypothetical protein
MTVRAQQHALTDLCTQAFNAASSAMGDTELLGIRIEMMKLERRHAPVITTEPATSTSLLDQDVLNFAATPYDSLHSAGTASEVSTRAAHMRHLSVARTSQNRLGKSSLSRLTRARSTWPATSVGGAQLVLAEPVSYRPLAAPDRLGNLRNRSTLLYQSLQILTRERPSRKMLVVVHRLKPVLRDPVAHSRFVQPKPLADLRQRQPPVQKLLQRSAIHAPHCLRSRGRECADFQPILCQLCVLRKNARRRRT